MMCILQAADAKGLTGLRCSNQILQEDVFDKSFNNAKSAKTVKSRGKAPILQKPIKINEQSKL